MAVSYKEIHAYMLEKTREYYRNPPEVLVDAVMKQEQKKGHAVTRLEAKKLGSLIEIQRYLKAEMTEKWPEFMSSIPSNSLREE